MALEIRILEYGDIELESSFLVLARDCGRKARVPALGYLILGAEPILVDTGYRSPEAMAALGMRGIQTRDQLIDQHRFYRGFPYYFNGWGGTNQGRFAAGLQICSLLVFQLPNRDFRQFPLPAHVMRRQDRLDAAEIMPGNRRDLRHRTAGYGEPRNGGAPQIMEGKSDDPRAPRRLAP